MPPTTIAQHPNCSLSIKFTEADKRYVDNESVEYVSVTTVAESAFLPRHLPGEMVAKALDVADFSIRFHANMDATFKKQARPNAPRNEKEMQVMRVGAETAKKLISRYGDALKADQIVFSPFYRIAGHIDIIAIKGKELIVFDWKTDGEIKRENQNQSCAVFGLSHLPDCDFIRYSLQLSMCQRILSRDGYAVNIESFKRILIHIPPGVEKPGFIETPDFKYEAGEVILDHAMTSRMMKSFDK